MNDFAFQIITTPFSLSELLTRRWCCAGCATTPSTSRTPSWGRTRRSRNGESDLLSLSSIPSTLFVPPFNSFSLCFVFRVESSSISHLFLSLSGFPVISKIPSHKTVFLMRWTSGLFLMAATLSFKIPFAFKMSFNYERRIFGPPNFLSWEPLIKRI